MTSAHHPQSRIVVRSFPESGGRVGAIRGHIGSHPLARRGGAKQTFRLHLGAKRAAAIVPVNQISRALRVSRNPFTETARVIACRQVSRVSSEVSHVVSPWCVAHSQQHTTGVFGNVRKAFGEIQNV